MQRPGIPENESARVSALHALSILDTPPEERFDRLTRMAKRLFDVPISLVSLVDTNRQWFKSADGLDGTEGPRETSFCGHAILGDEIFLISDATLDDRFRDNPAVLGEPFVRFYAGCPLTVADGHKVGTLCLVDTRPREFTEEDKALLRDLATMVEQELSAVKLATMDELTLISNRRGFMALSHHALEVCRRLSRPESLLYIDLDHFKPVNDQFGHAEGDHALKSFARLLKETFRKSDVIGRLGGDEFAVLLTNDDIANVDDALRRLRHSLDEWNRTTKRGYDLAFSAGTVQFDPERHSNVGDLMHEADEKMLSNKRTRHAN